MSDTSEPYLSAADLLAIERLPRCRNCGYIEAKDQPNGTAVIGPVSLTPAIDEDYWLFRVRLSDRQAIVGFPKFSTIGIGFAQEEDWNTNLPYTCPAEQIYNHIAHNKADETITREDCMAAIGLVQATAAEWLDRDKRRSLTQNEPAAPTGEGRDGGREE